MGYALHHSYTLEGNLFTGFKSHLDIQFLVAQTAPAEMNDVSDSTQAFLAKCSCRVQDEGIPLAEAELTRFASFVKE